MPASFFVYAWPDVVDFGPGTIHRLQGMKKNLTKEIAMPTQIGPTFPDAVFVRTEGLYLLG